MSTAAKISKLSSETANTVSPTFYSVLDSAFSKYSRLLGYMEKGGDKNDPAYQAEKQKIANLLVAISDYCQRGGANPYNAGMSPAAIPVAYDYKERIKELDTKISEFFKGQPWYTSVESYKFLYNQGLRITTIDSERTKAVEDLKNNRQ